MEIVVAAVGRPGSLWAKALDEYERRLRRYLRFRAVAVREASGHRRPEELRAVEAKRLLAALPADATLIALEPSGVLWTSERFAAELRRWLERGRPVAFALGGAHGLGEAVRQRAHAHLSLSPMTFPHDLARLVLTEQIYRALTLWRGEPYHK